MNESGMLEKAKKNESRRRGNVKENCTASYLREVAKKRKKKERTKSSDAGLFFPADRISAFSFLSVFPHQIRPAAHYNQTSIISH